MMNNNDQDCYAHHFDEELDVILDDDDEDSIRFNLNYAILDAQDQLRDIEELLRVLEEKYEKHFVQRDEIPFSRAEMHHWLSSVRSMYRYQQHLIHTLRTVKSMYMSTSRESSKRDVKP